MSVCVVCVCVFNRRLQKNRYYLSRSQVSGTIGQPQGLGSCLASSAERTNVTGMRARPDCGEKPEMGAECGLVCGLFGSGAAMGLLK